MTFPSAPPDGGLASLVLEKLPSCLGMHLDDSLGDVVVPDFRVSLSMGMTQGEVDSALT